MVDINIGFLMAQISTFGMLVIWAFFSFRALKYLHTAKLTEGIRLFWVAIVLFVPLFGALAVLYVRPAQQQSQVS